VAQILLVLTLGGDRVAGHGPAFLPDQGYFDIPCDHIYGITGAGGIISPPVISGEWWWSPLMSVGVARAGPFAKRMHDAPLADHRTKKHAPVTNVAESLGP